MPGLVALIEVAVTLVAATLLVADHYQELPPFYSLLSELDVLLLWSSTDHYFFLSAHLTLECRLLNLKRTSINTGRRGVETQNGWIRACITALQEGDNLGFLNCDSYLACDHSSAVLCAIHL